MEFLNDIIDLALGAIGWVIVLAGGMFTVTFLLVAVAILVGIIFFNKNF